jgi:hypothetical protein
LTAFAWTSKTIHHPVNFTSQASREILSLASPLFKDMLQATKDTEEIKVTTWVKSSVEG